MKSVDLVDVGNVGNLIGFSVVVGLLIGVGFIGLNVGRAGKGGNLPIGLIVGGFHVLIVVVGLTVVGLGFHRGNFHLDASTWARF